MKVKNFIKRSISGSCFFSALLLSGIGCQPKWNSRRYWSCKATGKTIDFTRNDDKKEGIRKRTTSGERIKGQKVGWNRGGNKKWVKKAGVINGEDWKRIEIEVLKNQELAIIIA